MWYWVWKYFKVYLINEIGILIIKLWFTLSKECNNTLMYFKMPQSSEIRISETVAKLVTKFLIER